MQHSPLRLCLFALLLLAPLAGAGLFDRALWTPDEPREADIAWRMSVQQPRTLAEFGGQAWLEKPPLSYWLAAASIAWLGDTPAAARAPNALYALVAAVAVFALGLSLAGGEGGLAAALIYGSALLAWRVGIWLAPDACLMAGIAVALLGVWRGFSAASRRSRLLWYTVMHAGAAWGFMSKSAVGWAVPALTLVTLIAWERRWREVLRPELWAGLLLQAAVIGPWIAAVLAAPGGLADLQALFWNNLAGRFADVPTYGGPRYATGHANHPGKYLLELPVYLLPWTALGLAALWRAPAAAASSGSGATRWRFAIAACVPWLVILSLSATARDVYAAPSMIGLALLMTLRLRDRAAPALAVRATAWTVVALGAALVVAGALLLAPRREWNPADVARVVALVTIVAALVWMSVRVRTLLRAGSAVGAALVCYAGFAGTLVVWALAFFPVIDDWQDLSRVAGRIAQDVGARPLGLVTPDETTIAMMEHPFGRTSVIEPLATDPAAVAAAAAVWLGGHGPDARLLVKLPGSAPGELTRWIAARTGARWWSDEDGRAADLERAGVARIVARYELPQGRRFALLAAPR